MNLAQSISVCDFTITSHIIKPIRIIGWEAFLIPELPERTFCRCLAYRGGRGDDDGQNHIVIASSIPRQRPITKLAPSINGAYVIGVYLGFKGLQTSPGVRRKCQFGIIASRNSWLLRLQIVDERIFG